MSVIDDLILREGPPTDDPTDNGGRTAFGISERANPEAWADGKVTEEEARAIYEQKYIKYPKYDLIENRKLREQMIDFGVNSGTYIATMKLQGILRVSVDGVLGPETIAALQGVELWANNQLVKARVLMLCRIVQKNPAQLKFLFGWVDRAFQFLQ